MDTDFGGMLQLMELMGLGGPEGGEGFRDRKLMAAMLRLMDTKRQMEAYGEGIQGGGGGPHDFRLRVLTELKPHMSGDRRHMVGIMIKIIEIGQLMSLMECRRGAGKGGCAGGH